MALPKLIDNQRNILSDVLGDIAHQYNHLSIATGYWDLEGTLEIIDSLEEYQSIRLLIGQEPLAHRLQTQMRLDPNAPENLFPDSNFKHDLERSAQEDIVEDLRQTAKKIAKLIEDKKLEVKIFRTPRLHAKAYIFGNYESENAVGIIGSSNFTKAGLTSNAELNSLEDDYRIVKFQPQSKTDENGHLSWFEHMWNNEEAINWTGEFSNIVRNSPVGDMCFGPYDVYIKTMMELFPDELIPPQELKKDVQDVLYQFQARNAGILINKLERNKVAMLSDSVGLGKTITAGGVIKHYLDSGKDRIRIIVPASLKPQWEDDLESLLDVQNHRDYQLLSQQDIGKINDQNEKDKMWFRRNKNVSLFVIDEAHNLRAKSGARHDAILEMLQLHPDADVLLLTATPINNSLQDLANQIQIGAKGKRTLVNVPVYSKTSKTYENVDFFDALLKIQTEIKRAQKKGETVDYDNYKSIIHQGLEHFLVRSTRQGVELEGTLTKTDGSKKVFPKSDVNQIGYEYSDETNRLVHKIISENPNNAFENISVVRLDLEKIADLTQLTKHPLDQYNEQFYGETEQEQVVINILQAVSLLGFTPYRPEMYKHMYYGKAIDEIKALKRNTKLEVQMSIHNIMHITYLKRLESSSYALKKSIENYQKRIDLFEKYLDEDYIVSLADANTLESDYYDDIDQAFGDYQKYLEEVDQALSNNQDPNEIKKRGVEKIEADSKIYNIDQIKKDLDRDKNIIIAITDVLENVLKPENDAKMTKFADEMAKIVQSKKFGKKILVFSFFADTVNYLKENLTNMLYDKIEGFEEKAEFISGASKVDLITKRFSPKSKDYLDENGNLLNGETELDYLFATDVLSEGQNLQDAAVLINYDLHWNPVRMIQRNGRVNRLGSGFDKVLIANMYPSNELDMYLRLVNRLENKINTIKNTVGLDQGVLSENDVNPIDFIEEYYRTGTFKEKDNPFLANTDKHRANLRTFLAKNAQDSDEFKRINNIPKGKWNYLPKSSSDDKTLGLIRASSIGEKSEKMYDDLFFFELSKASGGWSDEYAVGARYIEFSNALDIIEASEDDNDKQKDNIQLDRMAIRDSFTKEAIVQVQNPTDEYDIKPQNSSLLDVLVPYFKGEDIRTPIQRGITDKGLQKDFEDLMRVVRTETPAISSQTIEKFTQIVNRAKKNIPESRIPKNTEGILFYTTNDEGLAGAES